MSSTPVQLNLEATNGSLNNIEFII